jgi:uncharacterized protein (DUF2164 family)
MPKRKPLWDNLTEPTRQNAVRSIMAYFENERDDPIGHIAAEDLLDTILEHIQADIYNKGLEDAQKEIEERTADLHVQLDLLKRA